MVNYMCLHTGVQQQSKTNTMEPIDHGMTTPHCLFSPNSSLLPLLSQCICFLKRRRMVCLKMLLL